MPSEQKLQSQVRPHLFCMSTYEKGQAFLRQAASMGAHVTFLTVDKLADADWPRDSIAEFLTMPANLTPEQILNTVSFLARTRRIDRVVALDEFDLEAAALIREHMRLPGLGESATRMFRDKLAMRAQAKEKGIPVPEFCAVFQRERLQAFMRAVPGPWLLKPRMNASAIGIKTILHPDELWPILDSLGDLQSHYLLERFVAGEVFHVEGVTWNGEICAGVPFQYGRPPMQTMHQGGIFTTRTLDPESADAQGLCRIHQQLLPALGMRAGVTHSEFIRSAEDGQFYFLEIAARVGGAYIAETVALAAGFNPWEEWARIEVALASGADYKLPALTSQFAGSVICLARQEHPDLSEYQEPEIVARLQKRHHAGLLLQSDSAERIHGLVGKLANRFMGDFCAVLPVPEKATD